MWDRDSELDIYTRNRWHLAKVSMDFRSGKTDIMQIQKLMTGFCLGLPSDSKLVFGPKNYANHERNAVGLNSLAAGFFDNSKEISANEMNDKFHNDIPLLLEEEKVLKAFAQARDMYLFTNRRLLLVDTKGLTGQRVKCTYTACRWSLLSITRFSTKMCALLVVLQTNLSPSNMLSGLLLKQLVTWTEMLRFIVTLLLLMCVPVAFPG